MGQVRDDSPQRREGATTGAQNPYILLNEIASRENFTWAKLRFNEREHFDIHAWRIVAKIRPCRGFGEACRRH